jgi:hypothetical protein
MRATWLPFQFFASIPDMAGMLSDADNGISPSSLDTKCWYLHMTDTVTVFIGVSLVFSLVLAILGSVTGIFKSTLQSILISGYFVLGKLPGEIVH